MTAGLLSFGLVFARRAKLPLIYYAFLGVAFIGFILILLVEVVPDALPWAVFALGCAELGSVLEWILIPRVCALWERAHVFERDGPARNWNLRALRGFFLFYALGMLFATLLSEWFYGLGAPFFFVLSLASLAVLFVGNLILAGFTRYRFFPAVGPLPVEGPVENDALRKLCTLSEREQQVLGYIMQGCTLPQVAEKLFISLNTVKTHGSSIYRKLGVNSRQELFLRYLDVGERTGAPPVGRGAP
jgi:DNA-binding CsgD family transcriptional regulator